MGAGRAGLDASLIGLMGAGRAGLAKTEVEDASIAIVRNARNLGADAKFMGKSPGKTKSTERLPYMECGGYNESRKKVK
jgi:hypothetical protein